MDVQILSHAGALAPGSPLWILPTETPHSRWVPTVDWYLNFQWSRAQHRTPKSLAPELHQMAQENGFTVFYTPPSGGHLMVLSQRLLPNEQTVFVDAGNYSDWLADAYKVWEGLARPPVRLFLPKGAPMSMVQSVFAEATDNKALTVVLDRGET